MSRDPKSTLLPPPGEDASALTIPPNENDASHTWNAILETSRDTVRPQRMGGAPVD